MIIELIQESIGAIEILQDIPADLAGFVKDAAVPVAFRGVGIQSLMQEFKGDGFSAWYSRYWATKKAVVRARAEIPVLELRISLKNTLCGTWDNIANPELLPHSFQMGFVPFVQTRAIFEPGLEYQTFDIHFEFAFLQGLGLDYKTLDRFLNKVDQQQPAELCALQHPCSHLMLDSVQNILHNTYSPNGKARLLRNHVENILIAALELACKDEIQKLKLSATDREALQQVKLLIAQSCPEYPGNDVLVRKTNLNAFKLSHGFKTLFEQTPYEYFQALRFQDAKRLLREDNSVVAVAHMLEYESSTTFIKAFRKKFGMTPKQFQQKVSGR
jgi:AraC-like DNA-binding protein